MTTERLYYTDCYLREFDAEIADANEDGSGLYLTRTAFYPTSGGQPHDLGTLNGIAVLGVVDQEERILHVLERPLQAPAVNGSVDWARRYDHMQQHTGQHLLSAVFEELLAASTVSFHLGGQLSTIELAVKDLSDSQISAVEDRANQAARTCAPVTISFEEAAGVAGLRKQSERAGKLRIVTIEGFDRSACGGTHVRDTSELLPIQLRHVEKMRGQVRVEFVCGDRAIRAARQDFRALSQLARLAGTAPEHALDHFSGLRQRLADAEKNRQRAANHLAEREAKDLYAATEPSPDGIRRCCLRVERLDETHRVKALAFAAQSKAVLLLLSPESSLLACSPDTGLSAALLWKQTTARIGGSGGGSAMLAQGKLTDLAGQQVLAAAAGFAPAQVNDAPRS